MRTNGFVEIRVKDSGPGIPEEFKPRMFEKFARAELGPTPESMTGTGLGLAIVRGLARVNGGDAELEPSDNGACFLIRLPTADW
ncbi:MAG: sensor histidine kinase [Actinomycetota bacterium]